MQRIFLLLSFLFASMLLGQQALAQNQTRKFSFKVTDEQKKVLPGATVILKDNFGKVSVSQADKNGVAWFDVGPGSNYTNAKLTVLKKGASSSSEIPIIIPDKLGHLTIEVPDRDDNGVIMVDDSNPINIDLADPTFNYNPTTTSGIQHNPNYVLPIVTWGPYEISCDANPLASVPIYTPLSVEAEKTLADALTTACIGSAEEAVNSLVDATESIVSLSMKFKAIWDEETKKPAAGFTDKLGKAAKEDGEKTKKVLENTYEKTKELLENIESLAAGAEMYVLKCMGEGMKDYTLPEEIKKALKSTENYTKGKDALKEKTAAIKSRLVSGQEIQKSDYALFSDWKDVKENFQKTAEGVGILLGYVTNGNNYRSYERIANNSIAAAEGMINTLNGDCQIRACDKQLKDGIDAAKTALTASRKFKAQMEKEESKWRATINKIVADRPVQDRGWEYMSPNDTRLLMIQVPYNTWARYHNEAIEAGKTGERLQGTLTKLGALCSRLQPIAATLNQRVAKYEELYANAQQALQSCDFAKAENAITQMQVFENSNCGNFFPRPFGMPKSESLKGKIEKAKMSKPCKEDEGTDWSGTWVGKTGWGEVIITISGSGNSISATTMHKKSNGFTDNGQWSGCKVEGGTLTCHWTEKYEDPDKSISRSGTLSVTKSGDTISGTAFEDEPSFNWKPNISPYGSSMRKGAQWPLSVKKSK